MVEDMPIEECSESRMQLLKGFHWSKTTVNTQCPRQTLLICGNLALLNRSGEGLTLQTSAFLLFTVANLRFNSVVSIKLSPEIVRILQYRRLIRACWLYCNLAIVCSTGHIWSLIWVDGGGKWGRGQRAGTGEGRGPIPRTSPSF